MLNTLLRASARCALACITATACIAATADFIPAVGTAGDWNDPANWSTAAVPTLADDVTIGAGETARLDDPSIAIQARSISIASGGTLDLSIGAQDIQANLTVDTDLTINGSLLAGGGASGSCAMITLNSSTPTISGTGQLTFGGNTAGIAFNGISLADNAAFTVGGSITLSGTSWRLTQANFSDNGSSVDPAVVTIGASAEMAIPAGQLQVLNGVHLVNSGTLAIGQGASVQYDPANGFSAYQQTAAGTLDWQVNSSGSTAIMFAAAVQLAGTLQGQRPADVFLGQNDSANLIGFASSISGDFTTIAGLADFTANPGSLSYSFLFNLERQAIDFDPLPASAQIGSTITLHAVTDATPPGTISFSVALAAGGACNSSVSGTTLTLSATPEIIRVTAHATAPPSPTTVDAAEPVSQDIAVRAPATISITSSLTGPFTYGQTLNLTATDDSGGGARTWSTSTPSQVFVTGTTATLVGIGTGASVTVNVAATSTTSTASTSGTLGTIAPAALTVTIDDGTRPAGQGNPPVTYSTSGLVNSDDANTVLGAPVFSGPGHDADNFTAPGSYAVNATFPSASANYTVTVVPGNLVITTAAPLAPTINITSDQSGPFTYGQVITLAANSPDSTGAITWTTSTPSQISISGTSATIIGIGTGASVTANIAAAGSYAAGTLDSALGTIVAKALTVTVDGGTRIYGLSTNPTPTVTITGLVNGDTASALGTQTFSGAGTTANATTIVGSHAVDVAFAPANPNYTFTATSGNLVITKAPQTITFPAITSFAIAATRTLTATSNSGLAITYVSSDPTVTTVSGSTLTGVAAGSSTITASQAGDANHLAATDATRTATVTTTSSGGGTTPAASPADGGCGAGGGIAVLVGTLSLFWRRRR